MDIEGNKILKKVRIVDWVILGTLITQKEGDIIKLVWEISQNKSLDVIAMKSPLRTK